MHKAFVSDYNRPLDLLHGAEETEWVAGCIRDWEAIQPTPERPSIPVLEIHAWVLP